MKPVMHTVSTPPPSTSMTPIFIKPKTVTHSPQQVTTSMITPPQSPSPTLLTKTKPAPPSHHAPPPPSQQQQQYSPYTQSPPPPPPPQQPPFVAPQPPVSIGAQNVTNEAEEKPISSVPPAQPQFMPPPLPAAEKEKMTSEANTKKSVTNVCKSQPKPQPRFVMKEVSRANTTPLAQYSQTAQPVVVITKKTKDQKFTMPTKKVAPVTQKLTIKTAIKIKKPPTSPRREGGGGGGGGGLSPRHTPRLITNQDQDDDFGGSPDDIDINGYDDSDDEDDYVNNMSIVGGIKKPAGNNKADIHSLLKTYSQRHFPIKKGLSVSSPRGGPLTNTKKVSPQRSTFAIGVSVPLPPEEEEEVMEDNEDEDDENDEKDGEDQADSEDDEEIQKHEREINSLNSKIYKLEKIIEDDHKRIEALMAEKEADKKHMLEDSLMQVNSIFSAIPIRSLLLESGRFVLFTSLVVDDESVFEKLASESVAASQAAVAAAAAADGGQKKLGSKLFGTSNTQQQQQQQQSAMNLQLNFLKRSYVLKKKDDDGMFYIRGQVGFKMGFDKEAGGLSSGEVHVVAWIQRANYSNIEKIPSSSIKVSKTGFQFSIEHSDPRMMDGSIINWIAYTVPRANQDLMATMDAIMNPQRFGKGEAAQTEIHAIVKRFLQKYHVEERDATGRALIHISATFGNTAIIKYLLKKGADVNAIDNSGWTALLCAVNSGNFDTALALLECGAYSNATSESGNNALHYLLRATEVNDSYVKVLMTLLERGCNVNAENNDGNTPLHIAAQRCPSTDVIKMLFTLSKPSLNAFNKAGYSPMHFAIERNAANVVSVLIECGADLNAASPDLGTPLDYAHLLKNVEIAEIITQGIAQAAAAAAAAQAAPQTQSSSLSSASPSLGGPGGDSAQSSSSSSSGTGAAVGDTGATGAAGAAGAGEGDDNGNNISVSGMACLEIVAAQGIVGATDPYCIIDIGEKSFRTDAASKTDSPVWNKTFRVKMEGVSEIKATVLNFNLLKSTKPLGCVSVPINQQGLCPGAITDEWYDLQHVSTKSKVGSIHIIIRIPEAHTTAATAAGSGRTQMQQPTTATITAALVASEQNNVNLPVADIPSTMRTKLMMQYSFNMSGKIYDRVFEYEPGFSTMPPAYWEEWTAAASSTERMPYAFKEGTASEGRYIEYGWNCVTHKAGGKCPIFDKGAATYKFLKYVAPYEHYNFFTVLDDTPIVFCAARNQEQGTIRLIILTPRDDFCLIIPGPPSSSPQWKPPQYSAAIRNAVPFVKNRKLYRFKDDEIAEKLIQDFMRLFTYNRCKFGLVYCAPGQDSERSFLANESGSADFDEFCEFIGEKITLQDFPGYSGGLSKMSGLSGEHTIYTKYGSAAEEQEIEIVFHVSTMLPNNPNDPQKIEKKRHIGNDFIVLLFKEANDENDVIDVSTFLSKFNHIFIVVNPVKEEGMPTRYRVTVAANDDIRPFPPFIPLRTGNVFEKNEEFRDWLLMKLVNAERSALNIPLVRGGNMNSRTDKLVTIIAKSSKKKAK